MLKALATMPVIANTGAMLLIGQERSRDSAALAVESCCDPIVAVVTKSPTLEEFQARTTAATGAGGCCKPNALCFKSLRYGQLTDN